ncbi:MAG: response regulator [Theionarchaea archaeon]|nr:response regulator [Theionarchaea archaeon]
MVQILVVEDESVVAKDIRNRLQKLGYTVSAVVTSGKDALQKMGEIHPDLVLMDIVLKGDIDGIEAARTIRDKFHTPVVYVTAYADNKIMERAKTTEPYGYLLKPLDNKELLMTIEMALYKHKMERKLREREQWLTTTLKSIGDGVITTDTEGVITFMNPTAETLTGYTYEAAHGKLVTEVFQITDEKTQMMSENPFERIMKTGKKTESTNVILVAKNGTERIIASSGAPIRDEDGIVLGTVLVFREVGKK